MRTDWHRYNLKRRVASLPPISAEIFTEKVLNAQANSSAVAARASFEKTCPPCQKLYYSQNAYDNHLKSQRHRMRVAALNSDGASTLADAEIGSVISSTISLGEPISVPKAAVRPMNTTIPLRPLIDADAKAEFFEVVNGINDTKISEEPVSRRPTRPHLSSDANRIVEHPLSPEKSHKTEGEHIQSPSSEDGELIKHCLFCHVLSADLNSNVDHMVKSHGLFIPECKYLVNLEGLLLWLWRRVNEEPFECLYCHKTKSTPEAVQGHMRDSGHCKIAFEEEIDMIEVGQFYDFTSTYSDDGSTEMDGKEDGWEDDSDVGSEEVGDEIVIDEGVKPTSKLHTSEDRATVIDDELYLPSGKIAGHRALKRYFRQNLHRYPTREELVRQQKLIEATESASDDSETDREVKNQARVDRSDRGRQLISRSDGGLGMLGVTDAKRREIQDQEKRDTKQAQRAQKRYQWGINKRGNNQTHFRDPLLQ